MIKLERSEKNPILTPSNLPWEDMLVFNPGATIVDNKVYLLYRARGKNTRSSFGLATSSDCLQFERRESPIYNKGVYAHQALGIEDPRIVKIDDTYYITYIAVSEDLAAEVNPNWKEKIAKKPQIALTTTKDFETYTDYNVILPNLSGKDASFFPKKVDGEYWLLYRESLNHTYFAKSSNLTGWPNSYPVFAERSGFWDNARAGVGAPPIETEKGWLLFYHGVDEKNTYRLGIMFLDLENPQKILYRSPEPILEPEKDYEKIGFIPNVVFTCGAIEKDEKYYVYYGACDQVIGVATIDKKAVLGLF